MPEAFEIGLRAVEIDPELIDYRYNQSWYSLASDNIERAKEEVQKTLAIDPAYVKAFLVRALIALEEDQPDDATAAYHHVEGLSSFGASQGAAGLADLAAYEGRLKDAILIAEKGIAVDLENSWNYYAADKNLILARIYLLRGKNNQAADAADRAVELHKREELKYAAAQIYIQAGREDKAAEIANELGNKFQNIHVAYGKLIEGYISLKNGDSTSALKFFDEAQSRVDTWLGHFAKGLVYLDADAHIQAYSEFEICVKRRGEAMSVFLNDVPSFRYLDSLNYYLGRAQEGLNSPAAKDSYQKFLRIKANADPGNTLIADAKNRLNVLVQKH
jgi:tetratricopeptide (TPR) repeat protein